MGENNPQNFLFLLEGGDPGSHLTHGPLCPPKSITQSESRMVQPFLYGSQLCSTDKYLKYWPKFCNCGIQTDRQISRHTGRYTDRQTHGETLDRPRYNWSKKPHLCTRRSACTRCDALAPRRHNNNRFIVNNSRYVDNYQTIFRSTHVINDLSDISGYTRDVTVITAAYESDYTWFVFRLLQSQFSVFCYYVTSSQNAVV